MRPMKEKASTGWGSFVISFLLGAMSVLYIWPPAPEVEMSSLDQETIVFKVLDYLDDNGYDIKKSKEAISNKSTGWW